MDVLLSMWFAKRQAPRSAYQRIGAVGRPVPEGSPRVLMEDWSAYLARRW